MKAIVQDVYGSADVLQLREIGQPSPGAGEVLVQVRVAGADHSGNHYDVIIDISGSRPLSVLTGDAAPGHVP